MKIILTTDSVFAAARLKTMIVDAIKGVATNITIDTWSYTKSGDGYDIIFHNLAQYIDDVNKNVLFRVETDGTNVMFSCAWWSKNPEPTTEMLSLHTGRLTELLLSHFHAYYNRFSIVEF